MAQSRYRYLAVDLISGNVRCEIPLTNVQAERNLNSPGAFTAHMPLAGLTNADGSQNTALQQASMPRRPERTNPGGGAAV